MNFVTTQEAWRLIDSYITAKLPTEEVFLGDSLGRILVEDVFAPFDEPAFDKALKDGYAYNSQDLQPEVVAVQRAGEDLGRSYAKGECVKIMTGAVVPKEFDALVPVEDAKIVENRLQITAKVAQNICYQGEYLLKGAKILAKNEKITPQIVGILASVGKKKAQVFRKPKVGVLVTGDELVESFSQLEQGKKFDSNSPMLALQIAELGAEPIEYRVVADTLQETTDAIEKAVRECDLVTSGGASIYDYIPKALENLQQNLSSTDNFFCGKMDDIMHRKSNRVPCYRHRKIRLNTRLGFRLQIDRISLFPINHRVTLRKICH